MRNEAMEDMVARRNKRLLAAFTSNGFQNVRILGDPNKPVVVINDEFVFSGYVHNFKLRFVSNPDKGEIVREFALEACQTVTRRDIVEHVNSYPQRKVWKVSLKGTDFFLVGYNYKFPEESIDRYPVFARFKPKVYFDQKYATRVADELKVMGYDVIIL